MDINTKPTFKPYVHPSLGPTTKGHEPLMKPSYSKVPASGEMKTTKPDHSEKGHVKAQKGGGPYAAKKGY